MASLSIPTARVRAHLPISTHATKLSTPTDRVRAGQIGLLVLMLSRTAPWVVMEVTPIPTRTRTECTVIRAHFPISTLATKLSTPTDRVQAWQIGLLVLMLSRTAPWVVMEVTPIPTRTRTECTVMAA
jgi:hypothetical protein